VLLLGDIAPPERTFGDAADLPYRPLRGRGVRFLGVLGNHDVRGGRARGRELLRFLGVRARTRTRVAPGTDAFGIDTTLFQKGSEEIYGAEVDRLREREVRWLDRALRKSGARTKIVYGHHAIYTSVRAGDAAQTDRLRAAIEPVLERHGVKLYLAGHYHYYERTAPIRGVTHMVAGGGGSRLVTPDARAPHPREAVAQENHAILFESTADGLAFEMLSADGETLDHGVIR
jgi:3',5'-cyclic AMP phosphodiesterase CpdA